MEDERLAAIKKEQQAALDNSKGTYDQMLQDNEDLLNQQRDYADQYELTQNENLDKQLELFKQNIEKQKETARQNQEIESRKAKNDYMAYTNPYGINAETFASKGQLQSGLTQTAQLGGYNAYQNRLASANKVMQDAFTQYDLDMNEAIVNNDVQKAQNALAKLEMMLGYNEAFVNNKMNITQNQLSNQQQLDSEYYGRYQDMINQINYEKEMAEKIRQYEQEMAEKVRQYEQNLAYQKERDKVADAQWEKEYNLAKKKASSGGSSGVPVSGAPVNNTPVSTTDKYGNTAEIQNKTDYYFGNGYQPRYVNGEKLKGEGKVGDHLMSSAAVAKQTLWTANGRYYVWLGDGKKGGEYVDVTDQVNAHKKDSKNYYSIG